MPPFCPAGNCKAFSRRAKRAPSRILKKKEAEKECRQNTKEDKL